MSIDKTRAQAEAGRRFGEFCKGETGLFAVFDRVERDYLATFVGSAVEDQTVREKIYHRIAALRDIRSTIEQVITAGKSADAIIEKLAKADQAKRERKPKV
jgi:hypothetical protein